MVRLIIAGILGGIVMFAWGAVFHMLTPLGKEGVTSLPPAAETAVTTAFTSNNVGEGVYAVPGMENMNNPSEADMAAWAAKYERGPNGFFVYYPTGRPGNMVPWMGIEFASNVAAALGVAFIFLLTGATTFVGRVTICTVIGLAGWLSISISYWNWYRFPNEMTLALGVEQVVGWLLSGIVIAIVMRSRAAH